MCVRSHSGQFKWTVANFYLLVLQPTLQGVEAVEALLEATPDTPSYMIGVRENKITRVPLVEAVAMVWKVLF